MNGQNHINRFEFHNNLRTHNKIKSLTGQLQIFVCNNDGNLRLCGNLSEMQFVYQCSFVNAFQQSWSEMSMHFDGCIDDLFPDPFRFIRNRSKFISYKITICHSFFPT